MDLDRLHEELDDVVEAYEEPSGGAGEVRLEPEPVPATDEEAGRYDVLLDHDEDRALLVEPGEERGSDYQRLGEAPSSGDDPYDGPVARGRDGPSGLARAGASVTAGTVTAGFMTAEAGMEALYEGLRGLVRLLD